ncbi:response regulator [Sedimenticola hydrogenitrophicus]|uniref:response regulator n=1 Tax=Sedimenticola hydrogenitrophicus TaxID=2967975 RepID=UPI0023B0B903|nr:response regulator [Sedimenticola hydrogenitrophicus]
MASVLIVDDEELISSNMAAYLEDEGLEVDVANSAEDALRLVEAGLSVQVCIMDMRLPGMNGNEACQALHRQDPGIRFLLHTGSPNYVISPELSAIGITPDHLYRKPIMDMAEFTATVHALCAGR